MSTKAVTKVGMLPTVFDDFFKPWNEWFDNGGSLMGRMMTVPAVNIVEDKNDYKVSLAVPGMKKDDFNIDVEGNMLTISSEKEESKEEKDEKYNRKEYSYSSFSRSFTLPEEVNKEKIEAKYEDGVLKLMLPKKDEVKNIWVDHVVTLICADSDEAPMAYKVITLVMHSQQDSVDIIARFSPKIVRMADDGSKED